MSHPLPHVTPTGEIVEVNAPYRFFGNRGQLHDADGRLVRSSVGDGWIICEIDALGPPETFRQPGHYTELFFVDEATAFAAGHRPCFRCRRDAANRFRTAWCAANGTSSTSAEDLDRVLGGDRRATPWSAAMSSLPNGTFVRADGKPALVWDEQLVPWSVTGYAVPRPAPDGDVEVLTPRGTVAAFYADYEPQVGLSLG